MNVIEALRRATTGLVVVRRAAWLDAVASHPPADRRRLRQSCCYIKDLNRLAFRCGTGTAWLDGDLTLDDILGDDWEIESEMYDR